MRYFSRSHDCHELFNKDLLVVVNFSEPEKRAYHQVNNTKKCVNLTAKRKWESCDVTRLQVG